MYVVLVVVMSSGHTRYPDIKDASFVHFISDGRTDLSAQMHIVE
jgi:hypothetical protein